MYRLLGAIAMTNRSKQIGTRGETGVVKALHAHGFPGAERRALAGSSDRGDILICPGLIAEVKAGAHARNASLADIVFWWRETERERHNAGAAFGLLVVQRNGYSADRAEKWRCFLDLGAIWGREHRRVEMVLDEACEVLRIEGWGDPIARPN
jgi:hypothetical protein